MSIMVIACYRPKKGKEKELLALTKTHVPMLVKEGLAEDRPAMLGRAKDGAVVEVFIWKSKAAIEQAHRNAAIGALWAKFGEVADFIAAKELPEARDIFAEFDGL